MSAWENWKSLSGRKRFCCGDCSEEVSRDNFGGTSGVESYNVSESVYESVLGVWIPGKGTLLVIMECVKL